MTRNTIVARAIPSPTRRAARFRSSCWSWQDISRGAPHRNSTTSFATGSKLSRLGHNQPQEDQDHELVQQEQIIESNDVGGQEGGHSRHKGRQAKANSGTFLTRHQGHKRTRHIVADDLDATLEEHRRANRASLIRYYYHSPNKSSGSIDGPDTVGSSQGNTHQRLDAGMNAGRQSGSGHWPASALTTKLLYTKKDDRESNPAQRVGKFKKKPSRLDTGYNWQLPRDESSWIEIRPWQNHTASSRLYNSVAFKCFEEDARSFTSYMMPTPHEEAISSSVIEHVRHVVKRVFPSLELEVIGSRATGISDAVSDIDISIKFPLTDSGVFQTKRLHANENLVHSTLHKLQSSVLENQDFYKVRFRSDPVPVLTFWDRRTNMKVQLVRDDDSFARTQFVRSHIEKDRHLPIVYHLLRHLLRTHGLLPQFLGGLHSYALFASIILALESKQHSLPSDSAWSLQTHVASLAPPDTLTGKILFVLDYLSSYMSDRLDSTAFLVSPYAEYSKYLPRSAIRALMDKQDLSDDHHLHLTGLISICKSNIDDQARMNRQAGAAGEAVPSLCFQDPANPIMDMGRQIFRIKPILRLFELAKFEMIAQLKAWEEGLLSERQRTDGSLVDIFAFGNWTKFVRARKVLGKADPDPQPLSTGVSASVVETEPNRSASEENDTTSNGKEAK